MRLSDYGEFVKELEMTALGKQAAAILRNLENDRDEAVRQLSEARANTGDMEARVVELEAVIQKVRDDAADWMKAPRGEMAPCTGVGRYFTRLLSAAPSVVLADRDAAVWDQGYDRGFYDRELLTGESRDASEGASDNPYRGDNR